MRPHRPRRGTLQNLPRSAVSCSNQQPRHARRGTRQNRPCGPRSQPRGSTGHGWCCAPVVMRPGEIPGDDCDDRQDSRDANGPPGSLVTRRASLTALTSRPRSHTPRKSRTKSDARTPKALLYTARPADTHQNRAGPTHRGHTSGTHVGARTAPATTGDTHRITDGRQPRRGTHRELAGPTNRPYTPGTHTGGHTPNHGRASATTGTHTGI